MKGHSLTTDICMDSSYYITKKCFKVVFFPILPDVIDHSRPVAHVCATQESKQRPATLNFKVKTQSVRLQYESY
jgi:hypothetical protein